MPRAMDLDGRSVRKTVAQSTVTTNAQSGSIDIRGLTGRGILIVVLGTPFNADNTIEVQLQDSADDTTFADVTGATSGARTSDTAEVVEIPVDFDAIRRYIRLDYKGVAGTTPSYEVGTVALAGGHTLPADE